MCHNPYYLQFTRAEAAYMKLVPTLSARHQACNKLAASLQDFRNLTYLYELAAWMSMAYETQSVLFAIHGGRSCLYEVGTYIISEAPSL